MSLEKTHALEIGPLQGFSFVQYLLCRAEIRKELWVHILLFRTHYDTTSEGEMLMHK